jgi:hypothetical protein
LDQKIVFPLLHLFLLGAFCRSAWLWRESVKPNDLFPVQLIGGAPTHDRQPIAFLDAPATLRPNSAVRELGPRPTLGELQRTTPWIWLWCERCQHHAPLACAVAVILWGPDASSDKLRAGARCTGCGTLAFAVTRSLAAGMPRAGVWRPRMGRWLVPLICRAKAYRQSRCCIRPGRRCLPQSSRHAIRAEGSVPCLR